VSWARDEEAVLAVEAPFRDAAHGEGHDGLRVRHRLEAHETEGFAPHGGAHDGRRALVQALDPGRIEPAGEVQALGDAVGHGLGAQPRLGRPRAGHDRAEGPAHRGERRDQVVDALVGQRQARGREEQRRRGAREEALGLRGQGAGRLRGAVGAREQVEHRRTLGHEAHLQELGAHVARVREHGVRAACDGELALLARVVRQRLRRAVEARLLEARAALAQEVALDAHAAHRLVAQCAVLAVLVEPGQKSVWSCT
jgi:hypothetical protein